MEELADECQVSRRTLFNYFDSKTDAVIGPPPELPDEALATFVAGGPSGDLIDDLRVLALAAIDRAEVSRDDAAFHQHLLADPHLARVVHERFDRLTAALRGHLLERQASLADDDARLLIVLMTAVLDLAITDFADARTDDFAGRWSELLTRARTLLRPLDPSPCPGPTHKEET